MSLINDALKRASASTQSPGQPPSVSLRIHPVEEERRPNLFLLIGLPLLLVAALLAGGWYFFYGRPGAGAPTLAAAPARLGSPPATPASAAPAPVAEQTSVPAPVTPAPSAATPRAATPPVAASVAPAPAPRAAVPTPTRRTAEPTVTPNGAAPAFPPLKLQGIYYRRTNPTALINNQNVGVGELVDGVRVVAIDRMVVTVELDGHRKPLSMQ